MNKLILLLGLATSALISTAHAQETSPIPYTLATCIVSNEGLEDMGKPYEFTHKQEGKPDRVIKLCCKSCVGRFNKDPGKYIAKLEAIETAPAAQN